MKKIIITFLFSLISLMIYSQQFNDDSVRLEMISGPSKVCIGDIEVYYAVIRGDPCAVGDGDFTWEITGGNIIEDISNNKRKIKYLIIL